MISPVATKDRRRGRLARTNHARARNVDQELRACPRWMTSLAHYNRRCSPRFFSSGGEIHSADYNTCITPWSHSPVSGMASAGGK